MGHPSEHERRAYPRLAAREEMLQAMRVNLLAKATASLFLLCMRLDGASSHEPKLSFGQLCDRIRMMCAACTNRVR